MKSKNLIWLLALLFLLAFGPRAFGQTRRNLSGWCEDGGQTVTTDGRTSTTKVQRSYPQCTVTVFDVGTSNLSTIASDSGGTPKANPFTASTAGRWDFWAVQGQYDIQFSGGGITSTFTRGGMWITTPATGGTGDVVGPGSATDNAVARFDTTTGKLIQNSVVLIGDSGNVTGLGTLNSHVVPGGSDTFALLSASQMLTNKTLGTGTLISLGSDTLGDMYFRGAGPLLTRLGIGSNGQCLTVSSGLPTWGSCLSGSGSTTNAAGADTQVQFNDGGTFLGADGGFSYAKATDTLSLGTSSTTTGSIRFFNNSNVNFTALQPGAPSSSITLTMPTSSDTLAGIAATQTFTNKTFSSSTNTLGRVTTILSGDATGDIYYRDGSGLLTRLAIGSGGQILNVSGGLPAWTAAPASVNPTNNFLPYRSSATSFLDSPLSVGTNLALSSAITARTSGAPTHFFRLITPADTNLTASTESVGVQLGGDSSAAQVIRTFATGALATQRENLFIAPTYAFAGASTLTTAATVAISGPPTAGTNATITNPLSLWTQAGTVRHDSAANFTLDLFQLNLNADDTSTVANVSTFNTNSNGTAANGFGQSRTFNLETSTTNDTFAAREDVLWSNATHASRTSDIVFSTVNSTTTQESYRITGNGLPVWPNTVTAGGTTGAQTINKPSGTVNFAAAATSLVVTNNVVTTNSLVFATIRTADANGPLIKSVVPASGSFTITLTTGPNAEISVGFFVINK
jgi:hypothetical protein